MARDWDLSRLDREALMALRHQVELELENRAVEEGLRREARRHPSLNGAVSPAPKRRGKSG